MKPGILKCPKISPIVVGTGLVALDLVISADQKAPAKYYAGGTCGNVLTILSYLGWSAYPVTRLGKDAAAVRLRRDLSRWNVRLDFSNLEPTASTPVIVEKITRNAKGQATHRFSFTCPACGAWFPGYQPVRASSVEGILPAIDRPTVFFFDRVSRSSILLAQRCAERGAIVMFEPCGVGDPKLFREAISSCHIFKYSTDRLRHLASMHDAATPLLEIETLGHEGLRFRSTLPDQKGTGWQHLPAYTVEAVADTAGAGDWLTAAVLSKLGGSGLSGLARSSSKQLLDALRFGQAAAAWNCCFEGPRGGMYATDRDAFLTAVSEIIGGGDASVICVEKDNSHLKGALKRLCPACDRHVRGQVRDGAIAASKNPSRMA